MAEHFDNEAIIMQKKDKDYLSTREVAKLLNVAVSTIQSWTDNGLLRAWTTVGGHRRIEKYSVEKMLHKQQIVLNENPQDKKLSIVVVEDNEQELKIYEQQFSLWDINANFYINKDGYSGLLAVGKISPDIIITDLLMPNMNGFEMIKAIKENSDLKNALIIVVSALTDDEIRIRGGLPEDVIVFSKPLPFDKLEAVVRKQIDVTVV